MSKESSLAKRNSILAIVGLVFAILFIPPIFGMVLAIDEVNAYDRRWLVPISGLLFTLGIVWLALGHKIGKKLSNAYMIFLIILGLEALTRIGVLLFGSERDMMLLHERYDMTFDTSEGVEGHPFMQYTGKANYRHFNNYGFIGKDFSVAKPGNVIRIACLGEFTTTDGLPMYIEAYLNDNRKEFKVRYEAMCFAQDRYTSTHSLVTFLTTVLDFNPQYLLIHHGYNETFVRSAPHGLFRNDYSHALKSWERPWIPDALLIRGSIIYRHFRFVTHVKPRWWGLESYLEKPRTEEPYNKFERLNELDQFRRNIEHMVVIARLHGIKVILTTLPHTLEWAKPGYHDVEGNIDQCNAIVKEIAEKYKNDVIFIDLSEKLNGGNHFFSKIVEMTNEGRRRKTELIAEQIMESSTGIVNEIAQMPLELCKQDHIDGMMNAIHDDPNWRKDIERKAEERGITYNEMLRLDAIHMYNQDSIKFFGEQ